MSKYERKFDQKAIEQARNNLVADSDPEDIPDGDLAVSAEPIEFVEKRKNDQMKEDLDEVRNRLMDLSTNVSKLSSEERSAFQTLLTASVEYLNFKNDFVEIADEKEKIKDKLIIQTITFFVAYFLIAFAEFQLSAPEVVYSITFIIMAVIYGLGAYSKYEEINDLRESQVEKQTRIASRLRLIKGSLQLLVLPNQQSILGAVVDMCLVLEKQSRIQ